MHSKQLGTSLRSRCRASAAAECAAGPLPPRLFWRRRAKQRSQSRNGARRETGGRGSEGSPLEPETERVVTGGNGGGTQNLKPPPRKPGAPQRLCKPLCGAPRRGGTCRLAARRQRPGGGMGRVREGEGNHRCPSPFRKTPSQSWGGRKKVPDRGSGTPKHHVTARKPIRASGPCRRAQNGQHRLPWQTGYRQNHARH